MFVLCAYLTSEHGTEVIATGSQYNTVGRKICALHSQCDVTQRVALPQGVHGIKDGLGMRIGHDVLGRHDNRRRRGATLPQAVQGDGV